MAQMGPDQGGEEKRPRMTRTGTGEGRGRGRWGVAVSIFCVGLWGCAGAPVARVPEGRPSDLMVAATVLAPVREGEVVGTEGWPRSLRPSRFVIEADGWLRAAQGSEAVATTFPSRTRWLSGREMDELWRQLAG